MKAFLGILGLAGGAYLVYAFVLSPAEATTVRSIWDNAPTNAPVNYGDYFTSAAFLKTFGGGVLGLVVGVFLGSKMGGKKGKGDKK